jgi:glutamate/tyrosine decarboxylase-like PLP-dependent enzyme
VPSTPISSRDLKTGAALSSKDPFQEVLTEAAARARHYLRAIRDRRVGVPQEALDKLSTLGGPLPTEGQEPQSVLKLLDEVGSPATVATMGGRFFGGVIGAALPTAVAAHWLADAWDQNACLFDLSPVSAYLEEVVLRWLVNLLGLPPGSGGALVTGAQMANFTALAAARHAVLRKVGWDVESEGLFRAPPVTVIVGEEVHATVLKALALLGFGRSRVHRVPADSQGRMKPSQIPRLPGPLIVCTQVGNVNTGACDPVGEICDFAHDAMDAWVHVDGAFGLWAAVAPARKHLVDGVARADSWATDAHKWLNVPQDSGMAIVREPEALRRAMAITAAYLNPGPNREPMQWGPESSRRARAVEIWAALRSLGTHGVAELVERTCEHAARFAEGFRAGGYEVLNDAVLNQVLISFGDDETTARVISAIQAEGTCWCGGTVWKGRQAMRISVSSWATTDSDVEQSLQAMLAVARNMPRRNLAQKISPP